MDQGCGIRNHGPGSRVKFFRRVQRRGIPAAAHHPGGKPGGNLNSISHRCYLREVAFEWELTKETIDLPMGCLQGGACLGCPWQPVRSVDVRARVGSCRSELEWEGTLRKRSELPLMPTMRCVEVISMSNLV